MKIEIVHIFLWYFRSENYFTGEKRELEIDLKWCQRVFFFVFVWIIENDIRSNRFEMHFIECTLANRSQSIDVEDDGVKGIIEKWNEKSRRHRSMRIQIVGEGKRYYVFAKLQLTVTWHRRNIATAHNFSKRSIAKCHREQEMTESAWNSIINRKQNRNFVSITRRFFHLFVCTVRM